MLWRNYQIVCTKSIIIWSHQVEHKHVKIVHTRTIWIVRGLKKEVAAVYRHTTIKQAALTEKRKVHTIVNIFSGHSLKSQQWEGLKTCAEGGGGLPVVLALKWALLVTNTKPDVAELTWERNREWDWERERDSVYLRESVKVPLYVGVCTCERVRDRVRLSVSEIKNVLSLFPGLSA